MIETLRRAWQLLDRRERRRWLTLVPLALVAAALEAAGAAAVFALIRLIDDPGFADASPPVAGLRRRLGLADRHDFVVAATVLVASFHVGKNAFVAAAIRRQYAIAAETIADLARRTLGAYFALPFPDASRRSSAELVRNATDTVHAAVRGVLLSIVNLLSEGLVVVAIVAVLLATAPLPSVLALGGVAAALAGILRVTRRIFLRAGADEQQRKLDSLRSLQRGLGALREIKVTGRARFFLDDFAERHAALARAQALHATLSVAPRLLVETVFVLGALAVVIVLLRSDADGVAVPLLGAFAYAGFRIIPSANRILMNLNNVQYGAAAVAVIDEDLRRSRAGPVDPGEAEAPLSFERCLRIENVSYAHPGSAEPVLREVSFEVAVGESVGIVGPSGAGKSTLLDLLLGLRSPVRGRITVDGRDLATCIRAWQRRIGYVPQDPFLADDTLRRNVAFGLDDAEIDEARVVEAIRGAKLAALVAAWPDGLDTVLGERGVRLSGGERQRVAIARALYEGPAVLVFDEATSALDLETEREILAAVAALRGEVTVIVVAHRRSTVAACDRLLVLHEGRITAHPPLAAAREPAGQRIGG